MSKTLLLAVEEKPATTTDITNWLITRYTVAVLGAWCAEFVTYPFDLAKTRLQIQNEVAAAKFGVNKMEYQGLIGTVINIAKHEGPLNLFAGLIPMCQRHVVYAGCRLVFYERMRKIFLTEKGHMGLPATIFCGATCGAMAQLFASPADLVKVQMQAEGRRVLQGLPPRFTSFVEVYKMIYRESGILGFWRGAVPNMQRAALVNIGDLAAYDYVKRLLKQKIDMQEGLLLHTMAGFAAGLIAAILGTPADVLKTRLMNQPVGPDGRGALYSGLVDCFRQSVKNEGVLALYKGFIPMWLRLGPWALVNWIAFERIMMLIGGEAF